MRSARMFALLALVLAGASMLPQKAVAQQVSVSFQVFYDELSPYGTWVDYPDRGYVWIPSGRPGFSPYATDGHWVFTEEGWMWVSDYPWGWAAFHYGRWDYDSVYGWYWVPDEVWGPAWVSWRRSPGYYGWAPLRPGISISIAFGSTYQEPHERWIFVRDRDITRRDVSRRYINRSQNVTIINSSTVIVNTRTDSRRNGTYIAGPDRDDVQKATRSKIEPVVVRDNDKPGQRAGRGEVSMYRPLMRKEPDNDRKPSPAAVKRLNEVRPESERNSGARERKVQPAERDRKSSSPNSREVSPAPKQGKEKRPQGVAPTKKERTPQPSQPKNTQSPDRKKKRGQ